MNLPQFLVIGAAKSGTTSLWAYLSQHPGVFMPGNKEPNYFAFAGASLPEAGPESPEVLQKLLYSYSITTPSAYSALFEPARSSQVTGEASVRYLYSPEAPGRIKGAVPGVRLIAILREPVSRLYSHYCMNRQFGLEPLSLLEAIEEEPARRREKWGYDWHYVNVSSYFHQVKRYLEMFDREQIKIFLFDEFKERPMSVFQAVCRHIGVDEQFVPDMSQREKVAYSPKSVSLERWLHWPNRTRSILEARLPAGMSQALTSRLERWNSSPIPSLEPDVRRQLAGLFRSDIENLEELLGQRIPWGR
jgi:Sulfotransferase family